ncbi:MAG: hypothetical protein U1F43_33575 [Myxococcota bacterium]
MGGLGDFAKAMAQIGKAIGAAALEKMEREMAHRLAAELASPNVERRMAVVDKIRAALKTSELPLSQLDRAKIDAELRAVTVKPRSAAALLAFTEAAQRAGWTSLQRFVFLQQVVPSGPISLGDIRIGDVNMTPPEGKPGLQLVPNSEGEAPPHDPAAAYDAAADALSRRDAAPAESQPPAETAVAPSEPTPSEQTPSEPTPGEPTQAD